jgi:hypothetical protein
MFRISFALAAAVTLMAGLASIAPPTEAAYNPGWGTAILLEFENRGNAEYECVAADAEGNAIAIWHQYDGSMTSVWSARYTVGEGWGARERVDDGTQDSGFPWVAVDDEGIAIAVWSQYEGPYMPNLWSNRYVPGEGWGTPQLIETGSGPVGMPIVSCASDGSATAVWRQSDGVRYNMWSNRYVAGDGWQTAVMIETTNAGDAFETQKVCMDDDGNAVAIWPQYNGASYDLWSNVYEAETGWGTAELIESGSANVWHPALAMDGAGNAIAVWDQSSNIWWNRYVAGSGWGTAALLETDDTGYAGHARVAMTEAGDAMAAWFQHDGTRENIVSKRYVSGVGWGNVQLVENDDSGSAAFPDVAMDDNDDAVAVWCHFDGIRFNVKSSTYEADIGWGQEEFIETENTGNTMSPIIPQIVMSGNGAAFAVWHQDNGVVEDVWANRYEPHDETPPPLTISSPSDGVMVETQAITVSGTTEPTASLKVGGVLVAVDRYGWFSCTVTLMEGANNIVAIATDEAGNWAVVTRSVTFVNPLSGLNDDIDALQDELDSLSSDLSDMTDELAALRDELDIANDDVAGLRSQNLALMGVLVAAIVLAGASLVAYLGLRKKVRDMGGREGGGGGET